MRKISLVNNHPPNTGFGNYAFEIYNELCNKCRIDHIFLNFKERKLEKITSTSRECIAGLKEFPFEYKYFFYYRVQKKIPEYDLYLIANQNLSFLKLKPKIVFCHDIIHRAYPGSKKYWLPSKLLYSGLKKAEFIIAASESTKRDLIRYYSIPEKRISVVYEGINHKKFKPENNSSLNIYRKYKLSSRHKYVFHLSSEISRKNVDGLVKAFKQLKTRYKLTNLKLLKAGSPQYQKDRRRLLKLIKRLDLQEEVIFLDHVSEEDLPGLYNIAELFVFPSFYEGFGLPLLEAMACETPIITSNTSSLPEIVGNAGILVSSEDIDSIARAMGEVLTNERLREDMISKGLKRAGMFSWKIAAEETLKICEKVYRMKNG